MWNLEETADKFYLLAVDKISLYVDLFNRGLNTPEQFKAIEVELAKQFAQRKSQESKINEGIADVTGNTVEVAVSATG